MSGEEGSGVVAKGSGHKKGAPKRSQVPLTSKHQYRSAIKLEPVLHCTNVRSGDQELVKPSVQNDEQPKGSCTHRRPLEELGSLGFCFGGGLPPDFACHSRAMSKRSATCTVNSYSVQ